MRSDNVVLMVGRSSVIHFAILPITVASQKGRRQEERTTEREI